MNKGITLASVILGFALPVVSFAIPTFHFVKIPEPDNNTYVMKVNSSQLVVGYTGTGDFTWSPTNGVGSIGTLSNSGVNDLGWICGAKFVNGEGTGFLYRPGQGITNLDFRPAAGYVESAISVSETGYVVGDSTFGTSQYLPGFFWDAQNGFAEVSPLAGHTYTYLYAVNNNGLAVGWSSKPQVLGRPIMFTRTGGTVELPFAPGEQAIAVNDNGEMAVDSSIPYIYKVGVGVLHHLNPLPGDTMTIVRGFNQSGYAVGQSTVFNQSFGRSVIWDPSGNAYDLANYIDAASQGWTMTQILGMSKSGAIIGVGHRPGNAGNDYFLATPNLTQNVQPSYVTVSRGEISFGDIQSLQAADSDVLRMCKFIVPNLIVAPISVQVSATCPNGTLAQLSVTVASKMAHGGVFRQNLSMFDFVAGQYSTVDQRNDSLGVSLKTVTLSGSGDVNRYVSQSRVMRMRYEVFQTGPAAVTLWCHDVDLVQWTVEMGL